MRDGVRFTRDITYAWAFGHDAFTADECKRIISLAQQIPSSRGETVDQATASLRVSTVRWLDRSEQHLTLFHAVSDRIQQLNDRFYGFDLYGFDTLQFTEYSASEAGHYGPHMDMMLGDRVTDAMATRKLSATILLNDDFEGGQFAIYTGATDPSLAQIVEMRVGSIVVFPSFVLHEVRPVTEGVRHSLVAWCMGPKFR